MTGFEKPQVLVALLAILKKQVSTRFSLEHKYDEDEHLSKSRMQRMSVRVLVRSFNSGMFLASDLLGWLRIALLPEVYDAFAVPLVCLFVGTTGTSNGPVWAARLEDPELGHDLIRWLLPEDAKLNETVFPTQNPGIRVHQSELSAQRSALSWQDWKKDVCKTGWLDPEPDPDQDEEEEQEKVSSQAICRRL